MRVFEAHLHFRFEKNAGKWSQCLNVARDSISCSERCETLKFSPQNPLYPFNDRKTKLNIKLKSIVELGFVNSSLLAVKFIRLLKHLKHLRCEIWRLTKVDKKKNRSNIRRWCGTKAKLADDSEVKTVYDLRQMHNPIFAFVEKFLKLHLILFTHMLTCSMHSAPSRNEELPWV